MDRQKEPQVSPAQIREELNAAKERIASQAEQLSLKEYMKAHPYITLGAAFLSGVLLGGSSEGREGLAKAVVNIINNEVTYHKNEKN